MMPVLHPTGSRPLAFDAGMSDRPGCVKGRKKENAPNRASRKGEELKASAAAMRGTGFLLSLACACQALCRTPVCLGASCAACRKPCIGEACRGACGRHGVRVPEAGSAAQHVNARASFAEASLLIREMTVSWPWALGSVAALNGTTSPASSSASCVALF